MQLKSSGVSTEAAVVHGMSRIAKVILVAGAVMASVFGGFRFTDDVIVKQLGFGLAVAVLIDILVVQMLVALAVVTLLGHHAWTLPRWLDRILPEIHLEGDDRAHASTATAAADAPARAAA